MIDTAKRNTLKLFSVAMASTATVGTSLAAMVRGNKNRLADDLPELAQIDVSTRVSAVRNDLEIVLTNSGSQHTTITNMTPRVAHVARGQFDFSTLTAKGPLTLAAGESVVVPLERKAVVLSAPSNSAASGRSLSESLRNSISVITEGNSFASVNVDNRLLA